MQADIRESDTCDLSIYQHADFAERALAEGRAIGKRRQEFVRSVEVLFRVLANRGEYGPRDIRRYPELLVTIARSV